jgi:hypothetical protein
MTQRLLLALLLFSQSLAAQIYGNEWIAQDQPWFKVYVRDEGLYRLDSADLAEVLEPAGYPLSSLDPRNFQLFHMGREQYIHVQGEADGQINNGDYLEFFGRPNDGSFDTLLFASSALMLHQSYSLFNDSAAYFLTWNNSLSNRRLMEPGNDLTDAPVADAWVQFRAETAYKVFSQFNRGFDFNTVYSSQYTDGEGFTEAPFNKTSVTRTLATPEVYTPLESTARMRIVLVGTGSDIHRTQISVNSTSVIDETYGGYGVQRYEFQPPSLSASNSIVVTAAGTGANDRQRLSLLRCDYARRPTFSGLTRALFRVNDQPAADRVIGIKGFSTSSLDPILYDLTNHRRILGVRSGDSVFFRLNYDATGAELFVNSASSSALRNYLTFTPVSFTDYSLPENQGNFVMLVHPAMRRASDSVDYVEAYRQHRASPAGGNWQAITADINEIYDQFGYGIRKHPMAIRQFAHYIAEQFSPAAEHLFLVGHGRRYNDYRNSSTSYNLTYIPTWGEPGSDLLLAARRGGIAPVLGIGRLGARNGDQVKIYYDKMLDYDAQQQSSEQTVANKLWMKNILHFGGGISEFEQSTFRGYLEGYAATIEDTLYGGKVTPFYKTSTDPITTAPGERIDSMLNAGVSLMTFFGHSSINTFDYNIGDPNDFPLEGKYPVLFSNGCVTGEMHQSNTSLSEIYVFAQEKGSIAFIAASTFSFAAGLHAYARILYRHLAVDQYNNSIGQAIRTSLQEVEPGAGTSTRLAMEHTTLHGDPSITLNTHALPDYAIEAPYVSYVPERVTVASDSFDLALQVFNLGRAIDTSIFVSLRRIFPDGSQTEWLDRFKAPLYRDTVYLRLPTEASRAVGLNTLEIRVDAQSEIAELDEFNNILSVNLLITSNDALPIWPYDFAIMGAAPEALKASTADAFAPERQYVFQIDTSDLFNSPVLRETRISQSGGVLEWASPPVAWTDSTVYYWRVSMDSLYGNSLSWRRHSFVYLPGSSPGWNQSHYYQYQANRFTNMELDPDRVFRFVNNVRVLDFQTGGTAWFQVISYLDNNQQAFGSCANEGFVVFVFNPANGLPWTTFNTGGGLGRYGDYYCSSQPTQAFIQYRTNLASEREALFRLLMDTVPDGYYVGAYTTTVEPDYALFGNEKYLWGSDSLSLLDAFQFYGAEAVLGFDTLSYRPPYAFFGRKGFPEVAEEVFGASSTELIQASFAIPGFWTEGLFSSAPIGPAAEWGSLEWKTTPFESLNTDDIKIKVSGISASGAESVLAEGVRASDTSLAWIDAEAWPWLRLSMELIDDSLRTPGQTDFWRVRYRPVPEAALNPAARFSISRDSLFQGESLELEVASDNISLWDMDSLLVRFEVIDQNNVRHPLPYPRQDSLRSGERQIQRITLDTREIPAGKNLLAIEINPDFDQPEQYRFNNLGLVPFTVIGDRVNPYLDVTFDGVRILDGDLVSSRPNILIRLTDENPILALDDTTHLAVRLIYPDGSSRPVWYNDPILRFTPAESSSLSSGNRAELELEPIFEQDGIYTLVVSGKDASNNKAGELDYRIGFEVVTAAMVSNVLNYPNPFTTRTHFVFTLTGHEIPDYFKIQIMTVSGKIIREIQRSELGPLRIGVNKTEFTWDGTDAYGDAVGNGLYLYRVVARLNGERMDHYQTGADRWFRSGFGKMYLAR